MLTMVRCKVVSFITILTPTYIPPSPQPPPCSLLPKSFSADLCETCPGGLFPVDPELFSSLMPFYEKNLADGSGDGAELVECLPSSSGALSLVLQCKTGQGDSCNTQEVGTRERIGGFKVTLAAL